MYIAGHFGSSSPSTFKIFIAKFNNMIAINDHLAYSTTLGGSGDYSSYPAITVDSGGKAYITGSTTSPTFPVVDDFQDTHAGGEDAFVLVLSADGSTVDMASFMGGADNDKGNDILVDASGFIYVCGGTWSPSFPTYQGYQMTHSGSCDGFICVIAETQQDITGFRQRRRNNFNICLIFP